MSHQERRFLFFTVPEFQGEPDEISREKCKVAAKEVQTTFFFAALLVLYNIHHILYFPPHKNHEGFRNFLTIIALILQLILSNIVKYSLSLPGIHLSVNSWLLVIHCSDSRPSDSGRHMFMFHSSG